MIDKRGEGKKKKNIFFFKRKTAYEMRISEWSSDVCSSDLLVRVAAPMTFGKAYLAPVIAEFLDAHPGIEIDLNLSDAQVDIVAEGLDVALCNDALPDSYLPSHPPLGVPVHFCAPPDSHDRQGRPTPPPQPTSSGTSNATVA